MFTLGRWESNEEESQISERPNWKPTISRRGVDLSLLHPLRLLTKSRQRGSQSFMHTDISERVRDGIALQLVADSI